MSDPAKDLIRLIEEREEFVTGDDGFVYWAPHMAAVQHPNGGTTGGGGFVAEWELRVIADELQRRNAPWQAEIDKYFDECHDGAGTPGSKS